LKNFQDLSKLGEGPKIFFHAKKGKLQISYCCSSVAAKRYIVLAQKPKGVVLVR
jgi:hypothetical protein